MIECPFVVVVVVVDVCVCVWHLFIYFQYHLFINVYNNVFS